MSSARCQAHCWPWHGTSALAIPGGSGTCHGFPGQFWVSWLLVMHRPGWLGSAGESGLTFRWMVASGLRFSRVFCYEGCLRCCCIVRNSGGYYSGTCLVAPALPDALALEDTPGIISGTPTAVSAKTSYKFTVTDSATPAASSTADLTLEIKSGAPGAKIATTALLDGVVGAPYKQADRKSVV